MKISIVMRLVHTAVNRAARSKDIIGNNVATASISNNVTVRAPFFFECGFHNRSTKLWVNCRRYGKL